MVSVFLPKLYTFNTQLHTMRSCVTLLVTEHRWGLKISENEMNGYATGLVEIREVGLLFYFYFLFFGFIFYFVL